MYPFGAPSASDDAIPSSHDDDERLLETTSDRIDDRIDRIEHALDLVKISQEISAELTESKCLLDRIDGDNGRKFLNSKKKSVDKSKNIWGQKKKQT